MPEQRYHQAYIITGKIEILRTQTQSIDRKVGALFLQMLLEMGKIRNPGITKAGDGNRTHVSSLEGWCSTIELHPHVRYMFSTEIILSYRRTDCKYFLKKTETGDEKYVPDNPV